MGWKNVKDHYRIGHIVRMCGADIHIGSPYILDILVINPQGELLKRYDGWDEDLARYQREMEADPQQLRQLIQAPDTFGESNPVYTYAGAQIIEKHCETPGWPNVTNDGELMYSNLFSTDKHTVIAWAKQNASAGAAHFRRDIEEVEKQLQTLKARLAECESDSAALDAHYPSIIIED